MGLPLLLLDFMLEKARRNPDFQWVEGAWVLEDNVAVNDLIEDFPAGSASATAYTVGRSRHERQRLEFPAS